MRTFVHGLSTTLQHREHRDLILELRHIVVCGSAKWHGKDVVVRAFEAYDWTANRFSVHFLLFMMDFRAILPLAFDRKNLRPGTGIGTRQTRVGIIIKFMLTCYSTRKQCDTQLNTHKERSRPRAPAEKISEINIKDVFFLFIGLGLLLPLGLTPTHLFRHAFYALRMPFQDHILASPSAHEMAHRVKEIRIRADEEAQQIPTSARIPLLNVRRYHSLPHQSCPQLSFVCCW